MDDVYFSNLKFKIYNNIIIHYVGKNTSDFILEISTILSDIVFNFYENKFIKKMIKSNYFYFLDSEQESIYKLCIDACAENNIISNYTIINAFYTFLYDNKAMILDGFINFRLYNYMKNLDSIVDMCVNKFIIDREYLEFIKLLKSYIASKEPECEKIHLIYEDDNCILLDENMEVIQLEDSIMNNKYLSDITFSANDFALNTLLTLLPESLYIHLIGEEDDFINTLKLIFCNRVFICTDCDICNLYKKVIH